MLELSPLFGPGCVLPMERELRIFGTADGGTVTCRLLTKDNTLLTQGAAPVVDGCFLVRMPAVAGACEAAALMVTCGWEQISVPDVAVGLVFIAGGQSNMELSLWNADGGQTEVAAHDDPLLRWYAVPKESRLDKALQAAKGCSWQKIAPHSCADMSGVAYFFARKLRQELQVPVGVVGCYWGGTSVTAWIDEDSLRELTDGVAYIDRWNQQAGDTTLEQWQEAEDAFQQEMRDWNEAVANCRQEQPGIQWSDIEAKCGVCPWHPPFGPGSPYRPGGLHETMFRRITPMAATALLYYQGESDACETQHYDQLLEMMVIRWRKLLMNDSLPFLNMQLPVYADGTEGSWARIRQAQQQVRDRLRHTELTCIIDSGEETNIHPTNKLLPGLRLADSYLHMIGRLGDDQLSPRVISLQPDEGRLILHTDLPLARPDEDALYFEAAGEDGVFCPAQAQIRGNTIVLTSDECPWPVHARYAWINWGQVNVFGTNGRPLMPFSSL